MMNYLHDLMIGKNLTREQSYTLFSEMQHYPMAQQAQILHVFAKKKETSAELLGAMDVFLEHAIPMHYADPVIDIVGTGGDGLKTFNISTAASLLVASCGVKVAKHGGRRVTSTSGSMDVLEALSLPLMKTHIDCTTYLDTLGYAYLWAPLFNPLLSAFGALRKQMGIPTLFNTLGPLLNPIRPKRILLGVYKPYLLPVVAKALKDSGVQHAWIVHSDDGLDELSVSAPSTILALREGRLAEYRITPQALGFKQASLQDVMGGNSVENADIIRHVFSGKINDAKLDIVLLNSAAGLLVADRVSTLQEGIKMARAAIQSGRASDFLYRLQQVSDGDQS